MELLLLAAYLLLQVGDYWTTTKVLSQGGTEDKFKAELPALKGA